MGNRNQWLKYSLHAAVILGVVWAGVKYIDGKELQKALDEFNWAYAPFVALLGLGSLFIKAWRFASMLKKANEVPHATAMKAYIAGQSATLLPGGIAARAGLLDQVGIKVGDSGPAIALSSITDQLGFIVLGITSALFYEPVRKPVLILLGVLAAISIILGIEAVRTWLGKVIKALLGRFNKAKEWEEFLESMKTTLSVRLMVVGVVNSLMAFTLLTFALWLCMKGIGAAVSPMSAMLAFSVPTMLGRIAAIPGGFGVTEVGMVGVLNQYPEVSLSEAAAAVLVFRLGTVVFTALFGGLVYLFAWRKTVKETGNDTTAKETAKEAIA